MTNSAPYAYNPDTSGKPSGTERRNRRLIVIGICVVIALAFGGFLFLRFGFQPVRVQGTAMSPTLNHDDRVFVKKRVGEIRRGDIVLFRFPPDPSKSMIKRVIALPGETIRIDEGRLYINGSIVEEPYIDPERNQHPRALPEQVVKPDHYFVMGDNRDASNDSRSWGQLPGSLVYGKYMWTYWP